MAEELRKPPPVVPLSLELARRGVYMLVNPASRQFRETAATGCPCVPESMDIERALIQFGRPPFSVELHQELSLGRPLLSTDRLDTTLHFSICEPESSEEGNRGKCSDPLSNASPLNQSKIHEVSLCALYERHERVTRRG